MVIAVAHIDLGFVGDEFGLHIAQEGMNRFAKRPNAAPQLDYVAFEHIDASGRFLTR